MAFLAPFIIEEFLSLVYIGGAAEGVAYAAGTAAGLDMLIGGAAIASGSAVAGMGLVAGVVGAATGGFKSPPAPIQNKPPRYPNDFDQPPYVPKPLNPPKRFASRRRKLKGYLIKRPGLFKKGNRRRKFFHLNKYK